MRNTKLVMMAKRHPIAQSCVLADVLPGHGIVAARFASLYPHSLMMQYQGCLASILILPVFPITVSNDKSCRWGMNIHSQMCKLICKTSAFRIGDSHRRPSSSLGRARPKNLQGSS